MIESYAEFRMGLVGRVLEHKLRPIQVSEILGEAASTYHEITYEECKTLRAMGDVWQPMFGAQIPEAACEEIRANRSAGLGPDGLGSGFSVGPMRSLSQIAAADDRWFERKGLVRSHAERQHPRAMDPIVEAFDDLPPAPSDADAPPPMEY